MSEYRKLWEHSINTPDDYWDHLARDKINWKKPYTQVLNVDNAPFYSWFDGGELNIFEQCVTRHLLKNSTKNAIIFEAESGDTKKITYEQLSSHVCQFADILANDFGVKKGDKIIIYMPMIPEAVFAMLACAKIGAVHVVVFGGFSAEVLRERIIDTGAKIAITADGAFRHGKPYMLKPIVDKALEQIPIGLCDKVLVIEHNHQKINIAEGRDYSYNALLKHKRTMTKSLYMGSEDDLFILHTSGSTGRPKGIIHTTAGYILWAHYTTEIVFDLQKNDIFWCTADFGWITGHTYGVYGPLSNGATIVIYEGVATYPDAGRWWQIIEKHKITKFYTAPTAIRMLHKVGPNEPKRHDLSSLKVIGTVGEPMDPKTWQWYYKIIGGGNCPIVDTWWQTETGGHMIAPLPGATPIKPGSVTLPLPGISAEILDINGRPVSNGEVGFLCITKPWPSMLRSVWQNDAKYIDSYFNTIKSSDSKNYVYFSGDGAFYDKNGYITVTGRVDDVMNVSGHRVSSAEIESAAITHKDVDEIAAVSQLDEISGECVVAYIVTRKNNNNMLDELNIILSKKIGPIVKIKKLIIVPGLPKTRSGKVLRRALRSIARGEEPTQDLSTIEDPGIIRVIQNLFF